MSQKASLAVLVLVSGVICGGVWLFGRASCRPASGPSPTTEAKPFHRMADAVATSTQPGETPHGIICPLARPQETTDSLKHTIANRPESQQQQLKELERLQEKPFDSAAAEWLRWLIHQDDRHETLRNEAGKVLLNWNPEWLVADLAAMMEDPAQSETWRNYCVQHLWAHRTKYRDEASLDAVEKAAHAPDWVIRSQGIFSLANIAREENWKETQPQRMADLSAKLKQAIQTAKEKGHSHGPSAQVKYDTPEQKTKATERIQKYQITSEDLESAFVSVQVLELKDLAPEAEAFAGDESNDLAVRAAAVRALITVGRPESIPVLEECAASNHRVLAKLAALALKPLKNRQ